MHLRNKMLLINSHECSRVPTSRLPLFAAMWSAVAPSNTISWITSAWASQNNEPRQSYSTKKVDAADYVFESQYPHISYKFQRTAWPQLFWSTLSIHLLQKSTNRCFNIKTIHNFLQLWWCCDASIGFFGYCVSNKMPLFDAVAVVHSKNLGPRYWGSSSSFHNAALTFSGPFGLKNPKGIPVWK